MCTTVRHQTGLRSQVVTVVTVMEVYRPSLPVNEIFGTRLLHFFRERGARSSYSSPRNHGIRTYAETEIGWNHAAIQGAGPEPCSCENDRIARAPNILRSLFATLGC